MTTVCLNSLLVSQIRTHNSIKNEALLQNCNWTRSCFELVSSKINEHLSTQLSFEQIRKKGTTVSYKTLNKIFKNEYNFSHPLDPRALNTLDKLAIFIGYDSWSSFVSQELDTTSEQLDDVLTEEQTILNIIENNLNDAFNSMIKLSTNGSVNLKKYYTQESTALKLIKETIKHYRNKKCTITNQLNPSTFELLECTVENINPSTAIICTKEFWRLFWYSEVEKRYIKRYAKISDHKYLMTNTSGSWRIKTNVTNQDFIS